MSDILTIEAGTVWRRAGMVAKSNGAPITAGTVNYYLKAKSGGNAGKYWNDAATTWDAAETPNPMTHDADGNWTIELSSSPFVAGVMYLEYAKESGGLHIPAEGRLLRGTAPADFTAADRTKLTNCDTQATRFAGMIVLDGAVYRYTANSVELAPTGSTVTVSLSAVNVGEAPVVNLTVYQHATFGPFTIDAETSQAGDEHALVAYRAAGADADWSLTTDGHQIAVDVDDPTKIVIEADEETTATAGVWRYVLRNTTDKQVICAGTINIEAAPDYEEEA